jgi:glyoxalase family protein
MQTACAAEVARVELTVPSAAETCAFLADCMGFREVARDGRTTRLALGDGGSGREIDVIDAPGLAAQQLAAGTIHHVAWRVRDDAAQAAAAKALREAAIAVTPVRDRQYFRSIYFRIPGGVLFEIATDGPGFAIDEPADALGRELKLPPQYEQFRAQIAAQLPALA